MIQQVVLYGHPTLRQKAQPIALEDPFLDELLTDLWETMYNAEGVGLAAPQIAQPWRAFVVDASPLLENVTFKETFINPQILEVSGEKQPYEEGCLSLPTIREKIYRPTQIRVRYYDAQRNLQDKTFEGIIARVIQHEYDHLEGKLIIDYLSPLRRQLLRATLVQIRKGQIRTFYPTLAHAR
ncbi:MAG: peptide deformylase [Bacteroidia bacterium]